MQRKKEIFISNTPKQVASRHQQKPQRAGNVQYVACMQVTVLMLAQQPKCTANGSQTLQRPGKVKWDSQNNTGKV